MATTENLINGSGSNSYNFTFPIIETQDVRVQLREFDPTQTVDSQIISQIDTTAFDVLSTPDRVVFQPISSETIYQDTNGNVKTTSTNGYQVVIRIYRKTDIDASVAYIYSGSAIRADDLNNNFKQLLFSAQESDAELDNIFAGNLPDDSIPGTALEDNAITTVKILDGNVVTSKLNNNAVTASKIADDAVTTPKIVNNAVTTAKIVNDAVSTVKIADANVTTDKIADDAVTSAKLDPAIIFVPTGAITAFGGSTAPTGYLECNGQSTSGYPALAAVVGANVPDLRGEFVRGWDHGRGADSGRSILSTQTEDYLAHNHSSTSVSDHTHSINNAGSHNHSMNGAGTHRHTYSIRQVRGDGDTDGNNNIADDGTQSGNTSTVGNHTHGINNNGNHNHSMGSAGGHNHTIGNSGGSETRPRNVSLMYIIKT